MFNLVAFLNGDRVGTFILKEMLRSANQPFFVVSCNQSTEFSALVNRSSDMVNLIQITGDKPDWVSVSSKISVVKPLRGLSWFPFIFPESLLDLFSGGILNIHNSYLPFNRGRHSTFWAIVDRTPCGASIHWVNGGVDSGNVVERIKIGDVGFANADALYDMQIDACLELAAKYIPQLQGEISDGVDQDENEATHHFGREIAVATTFESGVSTTWDEVVKLLRATATSKGSLRVIYPEGVEIKLIGKVID